MKKTSLGGVSSKGLAGLRTAAQFQVLHIASLGVELNYRDTGWCALEMNETVTSIWGLHPNAAFQTLLLTVMAAAFLLRYSCPQW